MTKRKSIFILLMTFLWFSCSKKITGLTQERIRIDKTVFKIQAPKGDKKIGTTIGGHGLWFTIIYPDSSFIYYTSDWAVMTPNKNNYQTIDFNPPPGGITSDSTISGQQLDKKFWKEKFTWIESYKNGYWIGYKNVPQDKVSLFDKSILTLKR